MTFPKVSDKVHNLRVIQECMGMILASRQTDVIAEMIQLVSVGHFDCRGP